MPDPTLRGDPTPKLQRKTRRYNPEGGYVEMTDWASFSEAQILSLLNWAGNNGVEAEMTSRMGRHEITLTDTRGETRIDRWEFGVSEEQPSILQNPRLDVSVGGETITEIYRLAIGVALRDGSSLDDACASKDVTTKNGGTAITPPSATHRTRRVFELMKNGQTQYQTGNLVLRHTTNVSNRYATNISEVDENSIYYQADFLAEVSSTSLWIFPLPGRLYAKAQSFFNRHEPAAKAYYLYGWLKSVSPETAVSNNRVEIVTTYKLDFWSTDLYPIA
jgi:hypothetical protein